MPGATFEELKQALGSNVRRLRRRRGWTQEELADRADISAKFVGEIERADVNPSLATLYVLAGAFEVGIRDLFKTGGRMPKATKARRKAAAKNGKQTKNTRQGRGRRLSKAVKRRKARFNKKRRTKSNPHWEWLNRPPQPQPEREVGEEPEREPGEAEEDEPPMNFEDGAEVPDREAADKSRRHREGFEIE